MSQGRPKENDKPLVKRTRTRIYPSGEQITYYFDSRIVKGTYKTVIKPAPGNYDIVQEIIPTQKYGLGPVVVVFKSSNRKNARTKMKIFNKNIDTVLSHPQAGLPKDAIIEDIGIGESFIETFRAKYNL